MPATLCHGDFHAGNLLWDKTGEPDTVWIIDWQITGIGPAILDVAWLMCFGVAQTDLPFVRKEYLPEYHEALVNQGVGNYDYDQFLSDYRYGLLDGLARLTAFLSTVDFAQDNLAAFASLRVGSVAAAAEDAGCADLIS
jgi:aminoglycoside phosphotransferase (APT) family kinase protein